MSANGYPFKLQTQPPTQEEQKLFGIFISHSSADNAYVKELDTKMRAVSIHPIQDGDFIHGGQNFHDRIRECIKCYGCVVIVTENSLASDWVHYECGYFSQSGNRVVLWDPKDILSLRPAEKKKLLNILAPQKGPSVEGLLNFHLTQYLPVCHTADEVVKELQKLSPYADLYTEACQSYSIREFQEDLQKNVATTMVYLNSPLLAGKKDLFKECKLSTLVVNFGMYYPDQADGVHCWATRSMNMDGSYTADDSCLLSGGVCKHSGLKCSMYSRGGIDRDMKQCVILNHIIPNGRYFDKGEKDYSKRPLEDGMLGFYVPVHKLYGTEFKFIIDPPNQAKHAELIRLFNKMELDPSVSGSLNGWRIYLSIPSIPYQGFFKLEHIFHNNFLCPRAGYDLQDR